MAALTLVFNEVSGFICKLTQKKLIPGNNFWLASRIKYFFGAITSAFLME
jgi:hypothetical protein